MDVVNCVVDGAEDTAVEETGQMVVEVMTVEVTLPTGQFVTVGAQLVIV